MLCQFVCFVVIIVKFWIFMKNYVITKFRWCLSFKINEFKITKIQFIFFSRKEVI